MLININVLLNFDHFIFSSQTKNIMINFHAPQFTTCKSFVDYCWSCSQKPKTPDKIFLNFSRPVLRPKIIGICKNCNQKSKINRKLKLCFLCDYISCLS